MIENDVVKTNNITVFGAETEFIGELEFTDNLVITGSYSGTIKSGGNLEIAKTAVCTVDIIKTDTIVVSGQITGNIEAPDRLEMKSGCKITGDITTSRLKIEDNVDFHGQVTMLDENIETPDIFAVTPPEYKQMLSSTDSEEGIQALS